MPLHLHTHTPTPMHTHPQPCMHKQPRTHPRPCTHIHGHVHTHTPMHTHPRPLHLHTHSHAHTRPPTQPRTHTLAHAPTHTHTPTCREGHGKQRYSPCSPSPKDQGDGIAGQHSCQAGEVRVPVRGPLANPLVQLHLQERPADRADLTRCSPRLLTQSCLQDTPVVLSCAVSTSVPGLAWEGATALGLADTCHSKWRACGAWMSGHRHHGQFESTVLRGPCSHCGPCPVSRAEDPEEEVPQDLRLFLSKGGGRANLRPLGSALAPSGAPPSEVPPHNNQARAAVRAASALWAGVRSGGRAGSRPQGPTSPAWAGSSWRRRGEGSRGAGGQNTSPAC